MTSQDLTPQDQQFAEIIARIQEARQQTRQKISPLVRQSEPTHA